MLQVVNRFSKAGLGFGIVLILAGALLPASTLSTRLQVASQSVSNNLLSGAVLFKVSLAIIGLVVLGLSNKEIWKSSDRHVKEPRRPSRSLAPVILSAILLVAIALRLYALNGGLWYDEIVTDVLYAKMPFSSIITTYESENQHFLYSLLAHASLLAFGDEAWALRLPAALFGVGSIAALYLLARRVTNAREALLASALLSVSYTHIWFSQNARGYSGLLFWVILSSWLLLKALDESRLRPWLFYAIAAALGMYTHVTMLFVILGQLFVSGWTLFSQRERIHAPRLAAPFFGFGFAGLLTVQLYAFVLPQLAGNMGREQSVVAAWKNPLWTLFEIAKGMQLSFAGGLIAIAALLVFGTGFLSYLRAKSEIIQLLLIPALLGGASVIMLGHHLWPRFFFFTLGFGVLVVIRGTFELGRLLARIIGSLTTKADWLGVLGCSGLILVSGLSVPLAFGPKQDYAGALQFVENNSEPGDAVVTTGLAAFPYGKFYLKDWPEVESLNTLESVRQQARRTWLIYTFRDVLESVSPEITASIDRDFRVIRQFGGTVGGGTIYVCLADAPPGKPDGK